MKEESIYLYKNHLKKLINTAIEAGGTMYEVAEAGGFLEANRFFELRFDEDASELLQKETPQAVDFDAVDAEDYQSAMFKEERRLKILEKRRDALRRYINPEDVTYNGFDQAWLVKTELGEMSLRADIFSVEQCMKVLYAERMIRWKYDPLFYAERINAHRGYTKLNEQISYIKEHYPGVYDTVWAKDFIPDEELKGCQEEPQEAVLGLSVSEDMGYYAVCRMENGDIRRVVTVDYDETMSPTDAYYIDESLYIIDVGKNGSDIGLFLKKLLQTAKAQYNVKIKKICLTCREELTDKKKISDYMRRMLKFMERGRSLNRSVQVIAFREMGMDVDEIEAIDVLKWAADLAGIPEFQYVENETAIMAAFENLGKNASLAENEIGLIFDFNEQMVKVTLIKRNQCGEHEIINSRHIWGPERRVYDKNTTGDDEYDPSLYDELKREVENLMMDAGLKALGIYKADEDDEQLFCESGMDASRIKRQLRRNDSAKVIYENGFISMQEDFPIEKLEQCFMPILDRIERFLRKTVADADLGMKDISKVYLVGNECEYPFIRERIEKITGRKGCYLSPVECVDAVGSVLV